MLLSILICTIPERKQMFDALVANLASQHKDGQVQVIYDDEPGIPIGTKRNRLLEAARGEYICFIDDDDEVSDKYIESILKAIETSPDCVGISGIMTTDGRNVRHWHISRDYADWHERNGVYYRTTNHLAPVKRELALLVKFPATMHGEDHDYSMRLAPLLQTEVKIEHSIYHYKYVSKASNSQPRNKTRQLRQRPGQARRKPEK